MTWSGFTGTIGPAFQVYARIGLREAASSGPKTCVLEMPLNRDFGFQLAVSLGFQPARF